MTQTDKSVLESPGKRSEKVYSHLKHSVNIPLWTVTLTFTPQKWGVNDMCPKSVLFTPPKLLITLIFFKDFCRNEKPELCSFQLYIVLFFDPRQIRTSSANRPNSCFPPER